MPTFLDGCGNPHAALALALILFGEVSLRRTVTEFLRYYHFERNHQGKENMLLFPAPGSPPSHPHNLVTCHARLGGLLNFYNRAA
jgi:hypothetical protein